MKKAFLLISLVFSVFSFAFSQESSGDGEVEVTTITINNARETNYKKDEETGNDVILLEGAVKLSVEKDGTVSDIQADKITYDRATEMLYAEGNVEIETKGEGSSGGERTTANSLLLNTSTLEGIFDGGRVVQTQSDALNLPSGSTLIVFSDAFGKGSDNVIAFKNSSLTFCEDENPHWHIDATRTWLLPGGEFAFFNALLYVGPVPVLYLPAFYYPKDELIFNPVFSYKKRRGYSVQTTTYLHGRKGLDKSTADKSETADQTEKEKAEEDKVSSEALYNFMKPTTLKEQRLEGLILHNLDEDYKGDTSEYLKVMADWYSNLGFFIGADGKFNPNDYISNLSFFFNLGFSKTVFHRNGVYTPISSNGKSYNDYSTFLGMTLPFRYAANIDFTLSKPFYLSISLPIYSDPYFVSDFMNDRRESMDWISFLLENSDQPKEDTNNSGETSSFSWKINGSYSPTMPAIIQPYINSLSLSLDSSINFSTRSNNQLTYKGNETTDGEWKNYTPTKSFYYPSLIKPAQFNLNLSGNLFSWPINQKTKTTKSLNFPITLNKPDELKTDKELEAEKNKGKEEKQADAKANEKENEKKFEFYFPDIQVSTPSTTDIRGLNYNLSYNFKTDISTQIAYPSANLKKPEDFDWNNIQSFMYTLSLPLSLNSTLSYGQNFFTMNNSISYNPFYQKHSYISMDEKNGGYTKSAADNLVLADYKAERQDILNNNTITIKPFTYIDMFKDTSLSWNTNFKIYRREFVGNADNPLWENYFLDFTDDKSVTENSLSLNLASSQLDNKFSQSLTFTVVMPPLLKQYKGRLSLRFPFVNTSLETGFYETENSDKKWKKSPLVQDLSVSLFDSTLSFSENYSYSLEDNTSESLRLAASWKGLNISYQMSNTYGYDFNNIKGWEIRKDKEFLPYSLSVSYNTPSKTFKTWSDKISFTPGLSTSVVADLIRPTNSYFLFTPSISFQITDFLTLKFSSTSKNSVLYWYFHNEKGDLYSEWGGFPGNIFKDLFDSFRFDNESLREGSGFKLKSLNLDIEHDLHDWKFNMSFKIEPRVIQEGGVRRYDFEPYFSLGIVWKPMDSMKTEIIDEYGEWEIK